MKKWLAVLLIFAIMLSGCAKTPVVDEPNINENDTNNKTVEAVNQQSEKDGKLVVEDVFGRITELEKTPNSIICLGANSLRMVSYLQKVDKVVGVEDLEKKNAVSCCYRYANFDIFKDLPVIGKGGSGGSTPFEEEIVNLAPELIIAQYPAEKADELQNKLNIPVICVVTMDDFTDPNFAKSLKVIGKALDAEERADEIVHLVETAISDLNSRTENFAGEKPKTYPGAVSFRGGHGLEGTFSNFAPLKSINAINISDQKDMTGAYDMDFENLILENPDYIFLTVSNLNLVEEQFANKPEIFEALTAFNEGRVYAYLPYNFYATNMELAIANAYYFGTILYPEEFSDIDIISKTNELTKAFLGIELYDDLKAEGYEFKEVILK